MGTAHHSGVRNITSILIEAGTVTEQQVEDGVVRQRETGRRIGETLVEMGVVTEEDIGWALSRQLSLTFVDVRLGSLDNELVRAFPEFLLRRVQAIPLVHSEDLLSMAVADPTDAEAIAELERAARRPLTLCVATPSSIRSVLDAIFGARHEERSQPSGRPDAQYDVVWDRSGAGFLMFHLTTALKLGASEIHFLPEADQLHVHYRSETALDRRATEPIEVLEYLLARLEALGGPALGQGEVHRGGFAVCPLPQGELTLGVSVLRGASGTSATLSLQPRLWCVPSLEELGLEPDVASRLRTALGTRAGLVIVSGPGRSGGSTTLASLVAEAVPSPLRTLVFEPRPAAPLSMATRIHLERTCARASWEEISVAQSADVIVLDGVLTGESVTAALSPAGSGRLLLVRTDWCDTFALLDHLMARPLERSILSRRLVAVLQQRLVWSEHPTREPEASALPRGRCGLFEVLLATDAIRTAIRDGRGAEHLCVLAATGGFRSLDNRARERVAAGTLNAAEAARSLA